MIEASVKSAAQARVLSLWDRRLIWLVLLLVFWTTAALGQANENRRYCKTDGRIVVFLVDITTPYDQTDKNAIVRTTDQILGSLTGGDKIVIRTISDSHTHSEQLVERCLPYCAAEGPFDRLFKCSDGLIRTDKETVHADIIKSLRERLAKFEETRYSDIVRTIFLAAKENALEGRQFSLYIYSDLIENSDFLPGRQLFSSPAQRLISGLQKSKLIAPLKNADVHVAGVGRAGTKDRRPLTVPELQKVTDFWKAYFEESGAKLIAIGPNI
jgi:hypothetical protein